MKTTKAQHRFTNVPPLTELISRDAGGYLVSNADQVWIATASAILLRAADRFLNSFVTSPDPSVNEVMLNLAAVLVGSGEDLADDICASAALSLAEIDVPECEVDEDGFAQGITRKEVLPERLDGITVGVLLPGGG